MNLRKRVYLSPPQLLGKEYDYVKEALDSNWIAPVGPFVTRFEEALAVHAGVKHVLATNSGTSAIHLALLALGVEKGDEVICSTLTFVGSANPIIYCGAAPVFIDSERETWNMDPELLAEAIEDRLKKTGRMPKAIVVVHLYGMPAQMDRIMAVALRYGIPVVEDAAEAVGSTYHGRQAGSLADIGVYSFNGNKIITTSAGGALLTNNDVWIERARHLANQAKLKVDHFEHDDIGYNYNLSNICAAIGLAQLETLGERVTDRRKMNADYRSLLNGEIFQTEPSGIKSNFWLTSCLLDSSDCVKKLINIGNIEGIEFRPFWKPLHQQRVFSSAVTFLNGSSDQMFEKGICLPFAGSFNLNKVIEIVNQSKSVTKQFNLNP